MLLRQFVQQKAVGILMIPRWKTAKFWPFLAREGKQFAEMFRRLLELTLIMKVGKDVVSDTFRKKSPFIVFRVNGTTEDPWGESLNFLICPERGYERCFRD
jgi:hypothetical protein